MNQASDLVPPGRPGAAGKQDGEAGGDSRSPQNIAPVAAPEGDRWRGTGKLRLCAYCGGHGRASVVPSGYVI